MKRSIDPRVDLRACLWGVAVAAAALLLHGFASPWVAARLPFLVFLPALTVVDATVGRGPAVIVLVAGAVELVLLDHAASPFRWSDPDESAALVFTWRGARG